MKKIALLLIAVLVFTALSCNAAKTSLENGKKLFEQSNYDGAIQELDKAIKLNPNMAEAYAYRSWAYSRKNDNATYSWKNNSDLALAALVDANKAIQLNPQLAMGYFVRGRLQRDNDLAIADYNDAIRLDPQFAMAYNNRGVAYKDKKDYDRAIADYTEAIRLDPNHKWASKSLAQVRAAKAAVASSGSSGFSRFRGNPLIDAIRRNSPDGYINNTERVLDRYGLLED